MIRRRCARRAFSLAELLVVMMIVVILAGSVSLGGKSKVTVDAFTEATKIEESIRSLRSAWLAYYAETYYQDLRVPTTKTTYVPDDTAGSEANRMIAHLGAYRDRPIEEDIARFGGIVVGAHTDGGVYIGLADVTGKIEDANVRSDVERMLTSSALDLRDGSFAKYRGGGELLIRIR